MDGRRNGEEFIDARLAEEIEKRRTRDGPRRDHPPRVPEHARGRAGLRRRLPEAEGERSLRLDALGRAGSAADPASTRSGGLTVIIRQDRFGGGVIDEMAANGVFVRTLVRMARVGA
jgi:hypothetical protein